MPSRLPRSLPSHGPLARYVKLWVAHTPGMLGSFFPPPLVSDPDMHHGTCVTHVPWCMPGSVTSSFLWSRWQGKRSRHSRRVRNPQFYVSGKRPIKREQMIRCQMWNLISHFMLFHTLCKIKSTFAIVWSWRGIIRSLWNLTGAPAAVLPMRLSNWKAIQLC